MKLFGNIKSPAAPTIDVSWGVRCRCCGVTLMPNGNSRPCPDCHRNGHDRNGAKCSACEREQKYGYR
jgi:hypothetical protein